MSNYKTLLNYPFFSKKFKKKELTELLLILAGNLRSAEELEQLKEQLKDIKTFEEALQKALYLGKVNQKWQKDCSSDFIRAIEKRL